MLLIIAICQYGCGVILDIRCLVFSSFSWAVFVPSVLLSILHELDELKEQNTWIKSQNRHITRCDNLFEWQTIL